MSTEEPQSKKAKLQQATPLRIVTWNCNGLASRCNYNRSEMERLVRETQQPDIICIQEVRLKASSDRGVPQSSEYAIVKPVLTEIFGDYRSFWSLASTRYAGTLTLIHTRVEAPKLTAFTPDGAINAMLKHYGLSRDQVGLPAVQAPAVKQQKKLTAFFAPKGASQVASQLEKQHNDEGRFQYFQFGDSFDFIQTYVPNNGTKTESFERRRKWDDEMQTFLQQRRQILVYVSKNTSRDEANKVLLWCGDMNCAHTHGDGTHWEHRDGSVYEWWTDESCCMSKKMMDKDRCSDDMGMPSFTPAERKRFGTLLEAGDLVDVWRHLHPTGQSSAEGDWEQPNWTWRGHQSTGGQGFNKYEGKGQRLDYFLLSPSIIVKDDSGNSLLRVKSCRILGHGRTRRGLFCGSDHCASLLELAVRKEDGIVSKTIEV